MRDAAASALGYETLRFDYAMMLYEWDVVVAAILPALDRAHA
jgi:very-short-patch-repair endonuclease